MNADVYEEKTNLWLKKRGRGHSYGITKQTNVSAETFCWFNKTNVRTNPSLVKNNNAKTCRKKCVRSDYIGSPG